MRYRCYAKVNLTLEILGKRADGFHELASLVHTVSLGDELRIEPAEQLLTHVEGLDIDAETNLVTRAGELLRTRVGEGRGAALSLVKRIPAAAGLGGGSSDAAATLVGLNSLWGGRLAESSLRELAAELGSDVPFFLHGGAAVMRGRGEMLDRLRPLRAQWLVLIVPGHTLLDKTRRLYAALESGDFSSGDATLRAAEGVRHNQSIDASACVNGFERAARLVFPGLDHLWREAEQVCERPFCLSGAGPALFAFARDRADARRQLQRVRHLATSVFAVRTVRAARATLKYARGNGIGYA